MTDIDAIFAADRQHPPLLECDPLVAGRYLCDALGKRTSSIVGLSLIYGVTGTLNNNFRVGASYTNFFSGHVNSKSRDQDFASLTASYSF